MDMDPLTAIAEDRTMDKLHLTSQAREEPGSIGL